MGRHRDESYLRGEQYATSANLGARTSLHARFSTNAESWHVWMHRQIGLHRYRRILDLGCGNGLLWSRNLDHSSPRTRVVLADLSLGMLREATGSLPDRDRFLPAQCSAVALAFPSGCFDAVVANHMLYHVSSVDGALAEIWRVLRPRGILFASTNGPEGLREVDSLLHEIRPEVDWNPHVRAFGLQNGPTLLEPYFTDVRVSRYPNRLRVTDANAIVSYIQSMETGRDLLESEIAALRTRVESAIAERGTFEVTIDAGVICGRRRE